MRGIPEYNFPAFFEAATELRDAGWEVFSPAERDAEDEVLDIGNDPGYASGSESTNKPMKYFFKYDLYAVLDGDAVFVLPGWERSTGARLEVEIALNPMFEIPVYRYDDGTQILELPDKNPTVSNDKPVIDFGPKVRYHDEITGYEKETSVYRLDLVPADALAEVAKVYGIGEQKYPSGPEGPNWLQGGPHWASRAALGRHLASYDLGQDLDPSDGAYELAKVAWHALALLTYTLRGLGVDTRAKLKS